MQVGTTFANRYRIERVLGGGGTGTVALARDGERLVALKVATNPAMAERFRREADHAMKLSHEHVVRILDTGRDGDVPYVVMEYLRGADLGQVSARGALPVAEVVRHAREALGALEAARALDLVHLDIKPSNLFLEDAGSIKLLGGWKPRGEIEHTVVGSPAYMAPERLKRSPDVDGRADVWAMGVTLYELLTAAHPFVAATLQETFIQVLSKDAVPLCTRRSEIPVSLDAIVARCLQRDPKARYETAGELSAALAPFDA